jgi:hypothetical protein
MGARRGVEGDSNVMGLAGEGQRPSEMEQDFIDNQYTQGNVVREKKKKKK